MSQAVAYRASDLIDLDQVVEPAEAAPTSIPAKPTRKSRAERKTHKEANPKKAKPVDTRPRWRKIMSGLTFWLSLVLLVLLIRWTGFTVSPVKTGSMRPTIQPGDIELTVSPKLITPHVGSIIIAEPDLGDRVLPAIGHRVIKINEDGSYVTQGDYNKEPDFWHSKPSEVSGVTVAVIPMAWAKNPVNVAILFGVFALFMCWPAATKREGADAIEDLKPKKGRTKFGDAASLPELTVSTAHLAGASGKVLPTGAAAAMPELPGSFTILPAAAPLSLVDLRELYGPPADPYGSLYGYGIG